MSPEALLIFWRLTKLGGVPEKAKVTAWGQLGVLLAAKFDEAGCVFIPTSIKRLLGFWVKDRARI